MSLDIDISNLEINQCEVENPEESDNQIYSFHGTHKCPNETTSVSCLEYLSDLTLVPSYSNVIMTLSTYLPGTRVT